jgi:hypothetical protein
MPSNWPLVIQQRLKATARAARAGVVATELFKQLFVAMHDTVSALYACLGWIAKSTFTAACKSRNLDVGCVS